MNDPHVIYLKYKLLPREKTCFENCPKLEITNEYFNIELESNTLICTFIKHFSNLEDARACVDPFLRIWEISAGLAFKRDDFHFIYNSCDIVDRKPTPGSVYIHAPAIKIVSKSEIKVDYRVCRSTYPKPQLNFRVNTDVETMWFRYNQYRQGREPLQSMAYFCASMMNMLAGGTTSKASRQFAISIPVMNNLFQLATTRGDLSNARKLSMQELKPLTDSQIYWLEECVLLLVRRLGEYAYSRDNLWQLTMSDLPPIE